MILPGGFTVVETRVSPHDNVSVTVVIPDGRKVTVHLRKGQDTPDEIASLALARANGPTPRGGR